MKVFHDSDYDLIHSLVFRGDYPGYKPTVVEIPNGDGKADAAKRYAHVAEKYWVRWGTKAERAQLIDYYFAAHGLATYVAHKMGVSAKYGPRPEVGALRILDYPPGAVSNRHEDFDLFTLMLYRDDPSKFVAHDEKPMPYISKAIVAMREINAQAHLGQIGEEIGLGPATPHEVIASDKRQRSMVYFAIPSHNVRLPSGVLVKDWLNERMARSRTEFKAYE